MCIISQFINSVDIVNIHIYLMLKNNEKKSSALLNKCLLEFLNLVDL